jgi:hypothetical protein
MADGRKSTIVKQPMIPEYLLTQIREGKAILFLGAGASFDAMDDKGKSPPSGYQLGQMLSKKFLGGKYSDAPLNQIGEYAISESDLLTVQGYIRELFERFKPTEQHLLIPTFRWFGLGTTNYDRLVEDAYETNSERVQKPAMFIDNQDRISEQLRDRNSVPFLKIHGCITRINNPDCPLILSTDQYIQHRTNRDRLFTTLQDWGVEHPFVFIGHSLQDQDIRAIMLELNKLGETRPRYYFVAPGVDEIQIRFWESRYKVTPISATFSAFMNELNSQLPLPFRGLAAATNSKEECFEISERIVVKDYVLSAACKQFLKTDATYVKAITKTEKIDPKDFYRGMNKEWSCIEQNLDVRRRIADSVLSEHFIVEDSHHSDKPELIVLKSHAGGGKSIVLRRIAWDAAKHFDCLCLWINSHGVISTVAIQELLALCKERIYVFVDNASDRIREIINLVQQVGGPGKLLTIVTAERINEWNVSCSSLSSFVSTEHKLRYLCEREIDDLLDLLQRHNSLGTLSSATSEQRKAAFVERAGRQLLVALHEATMGKNFEEIVLDEFDGISPFEAQQLYLTICVLNRVGVPIRANLVAHIHGLRYEDFKDRLFSPLEHIVQARHDPIIRDFVYEARHPHIAEIVFDRVLSKSEDRYDAYVRCLQHMNDSYDVDRKALRRLLRGRSLLDVIAAHELIARIYEIAKDRFGDDAYLLHQMALYEMHRANGNIRQAGDYLTTARKKAPYDNSILHSLAEYYLRLADIAVADLERTRCLKEAASICTSLKSRNNDDSYAYHTLMKVKLFELKTTLERGTETDSVLEIMLKSIEMTLSEGLQQFPGDSHLLGAEADLANLLNESSRVQRSLDKAFEANPRNGFIAYRLARIQIERGENEEAKKVFKKAIDANRNDRRLHFGYAQLLVDEVGSNHEEIVYHLERSFAPGDSNFQARLLLGRQYYIVNEFQRSKSVFNELSEMRASSDVRGRIYHSLENPFRGTVVKLESSYCFIRRVATSDWVFAHRDNVDEETWQSILLNSEVQFRIGFTFRGASAFDVSPAV